MEEEEGEKVEEEEGKNHRTPAAQQIHDHFSGECSSAVMRGKKGSDRNGFRHAVLLQQWGGGHRSGGQASMHPFNPPTH